MLSELSAERLAQFLAWLRSTGHNPGGIKLFRAHFTMVWRLAFERGLAAAVPRMRKMSVPREIPDSWTSEEMARLIRATSVLSDRDAVGGVPADKLFKAMILVGYWTALRRRSLLAIKPADVDFEGGWLYVHGGSMKSGRRKKFRLGADALDAIREIFSADRERLFPAGARTLGKHFRLVLAEAEIPPSKHKLGYFHKLRRTAISLTASSAGLAAASALAGHSASYVTGRYLDASMFVGNDATEWLPPLAEL